MKYRIMDMGPGNTFRYKVQWKFLWIWWEMGKEDTVENAKILIHDLKYPIEALRKTPIIYEE